MKICRKCGFINQDNAKFCSQCAEPLPEAEEAKEPIEHDHSYETDFGDPMREDEHYRSPSEQFVEKNRVDKEWKGDSIKSKGTGTFGGLSPVMQYYGGRISNAVLGVFFVLASVASIVLFVLDFLGLIHFWSRGTMLSAGTLFVSVILGTAGVLLIRGAFRYHKKLKEILQNDPRAVEEKKKTPEYGRTILTAVLTIVLFVGFAGLFLAFLIAPYEQPIGVILPLFFTVFITAFLLSAVQSKNRGRK